MRAGGRCSGGYRAYLELRGEEELNARNIPVRTRSAPRGRDDADSISPDSAALCSRASLSGNYIDNAPIFPMLPPISPFLPFALILSAGLCRSVANSGPPLSHPVEFQDYGFLREKEELKGSPLLSIGILNFRVFHRELYPA